MKLHQFICANAILKKLPRVQGMLTGLQTATRGGYSMYQICRNRHLRLRLFSFVKKRIEIQRIIYDTYSLLKIYKNIVSNPHLTTLSPP